MILTTTTETIPYTPPWREGDPAAPVFHLRAGSVIERGLMEAEISGLHRAGQVYGFELRAAVRSGVETLMANDPELGRLLELIAAEAEGNGAVMSAEDGMLLASIRDVLAQNWPPYRELVAQLERRRAIAPIVALRRFCTAIDAPGVTFAKGVDGQVSEATLAALDAMEMTNAGNRAFALQYGVGEEKNSAPPSSSESGQAISSSDAPSKADGKSKGRAGRKTPA